MTQNNQRLGVQLPATSSGSRFLWECLTATAAQFADVFSNVKLSASAEAFRKHYAADVVAFEVARLGSGRAGAIARFASDWARAQFSFAAGGGERPLLEYLAATHAGLPLQHSPAQGRPCLQPQLSEGPDVAGLNNLEELIADWRQRHLLTQAAAKALTWGLARAKQENGLNFGGERMVILGAAAEVAPTELFLAAGFDVLWLDLRAPSADLLAKPNRGALAWVKDGADLLLNPGAIKQTIVDYAAGQPVHVGLYAYAPGEGRELRLCGAMNAIVDSLPRELIKSVSLLISPTTPMRLTPEDLEAVRKRRQERPPWQALLDGLGCLGNGPLAQGNLALARSIVPLQGAAYQAAQYVAKRLQADAWFSAGLGQGAASQSQVVSANVAPITSTRSLSHPLFQAGFIGAASFGVHISSPAMTRVLAFMAVLYDLFEPTAAARRPSGAVSDAHLQALGANQIHGGIAALPYALNSSITVAALLGLSQKPTLLGGFFKKSAPLNGSEVALAPVHAATARLTDNKR